MSYKFCPGKATWDIRIAKTFKECFLAYHTGILPKPGHLYEQDEFFAECYPYFVEHYVQRKYGRVWQDVNAFATEVFKAINKMFGGK